MKRVIVVSVKPSINLEIKMVLPLVDYKILAITDNGMEALRLAHRFEPDLIIMSWNLRGLSSAEVLQNFVIQHLCPVIVVLTQEEQHVLPAVIKADAHQVIQYPWRALEVATAILLAEHQFNRETEHAQQIQRLEDELKTRKIIFQAVLILIEKRGFTEQNAYAALRTHAMSERTSIRSVARDVIRGAWLPDSDIKI